MGRLGNYVDSVAATGSFWGGDPGNATLRNTLTLRVTCAFDQSNRRERGKDLHGNRTPAARGAVSLGGGSAGAAGRSRTTHSDLQPVIEAVPPTRSSTSYLHAFYPASPVTPEETAGRHLAAVGDNHLDLPVFRCFLDLIPAEGADVQD
jgi:hypothetical protein